MVGFVWTWEATGNVALGALAALAVGALAGLLNGLFVTLIGIPSLVVTIGTQFLFRGLTLCSSTAGASPLVESEGPGQSRVLVGQPSASRWSSGGWSWWRSGLAAALPASPRAERAT